MVDTSSNQLERIVSDDLRDCFERVYVINLDRRGDRWKQFKEGLPSDWPFPAPTRVPAVDWRMAPAPTWWTSGGGAWGCYRSHLRVIEDALNQGLESVLILEDDAVFGPRFRFNTEQFMRSLPSDWSWVYLGGQHIKRFEKLPRRVAGTVYRPHNVNRCHAYGIRGRDMLGRVYRHLNDYSSWTPGCHIDHHYGRLHSTVETGLYTPADWLVGQREGTSNIAGRELPRKFFRGAASIVNPEVNERVVAVVSAVPRAGDKAAALLDCLGVEMGFSGKPKQQPLNSPRLAHEAPGLHHVCSRLIVEPELNLTMTFDERVSHLAGWAWKRETLGNDEDKPTGGMHRDLCLLWREMKAAWPQHQLVVVSDGPAPPSPLDGMAAERRFSAINSLRKEGSNQYELDLSRLKINPLESIRGICKALQLPYSLHRVESTAAMISTV